jgi:hypothetical protein
VASRLVEKLDGFQRGRRWVGFPLAVVYKFADDQGCYLAALIAWIHLLALVTVIAAEINVVSQRRLGRARC